MDIDARCLELSQHLPYEYKLVKESMDYALECGVPWDAAASLLAAKGPYFLESVAVMVKYSPPRPHYGI